MRPQSKWIKSRRPGISRSGFVLRVVFSFWVWDFGKAINSVVLQGFFFPEKQENKQSPLHTCEGTCYNICQSLKEIPGKALVIYEVIKQVYFYSCYCGNQLL